METKYFLLQILSAVKYMHEHRVIHRDLKLANLFLSENMEIKIGDFGLAAQLDFDGQRKQTLCGTPNYIAPEVLKSDGHSYEVDIWSIGVILYTLLIGTPPFESSNVKTTYDRIQNGTYSFPSSVPLSDKAKDLITQLLSNKPDERPTASEIMLHPFFADVPHNNPCPPNLLAYPQTAMIPLTLQSSILKKLEQAQIPLSSVTPFQTLPIAPASDPLAILASRPPLTSLLNVPSHQQPLMLPPKERSPTSSSGRNEAIRNPFHTTAMSAPKPVIPIVSNMQAPKLLHFLEESQSARAKMPPPKSPPLHEARPRTAPIFYTQQPALVDPVSQQQVSAPQAPLLCSAPMKDIEMKNADDRDEMKGAEEEENNLTMMHNNLTHVENAKDEVALTGSNRPNTSLEKLQGPTVWVSQWADFSNKYGLAYKLCSNIYGAHFNDFSKLIWDSQSTRLEYWARIRAANGSYDEMTTYTCDNYPQKMLSKKVTLANYFQSYLDKQGENDAPSSLEYGKCNYEGKGIPGAATSSSYVYVKRWLRTRHAIIFRLSNKTVQVCFFDNTEIFLASEARLVTFTNHSGERSTFSLKEIANRPMPDVAKRLKYTKDILYQLINHQK